MEDWIPVTKRLPEAWLRVITCSYTRKIRIAQMMRSGAWMPDGWHEPLIMRNEIVAWMPLPEAYKNEEE